MISTPGTLGEKLLPLPDCQASPGIRNTVSLTSLVLGTFLSAGLTEDLMEHAVVFASPVPWVGVRVPATLEGPQKWC